MSGNPSAPYVEKVATAHVEEKLGHGAAEEAKNASDNEHKATFRETFKKYRAAVFWSCVISMTIVMEGYDTILMYNFWPYPTCKCDRELGTYMQLSDSTAVQRKYGKYYGPEIGWQVPAPWQAGLGQSSTVGTIIGAFINGWAISKYGYKKTVIVALFFMNAFIFITFFAPNAGTLLAGELLCGVCLARWCGFGDADEEQASPGASSQQQAQPTPRKSRPSPSAAT